MDAEHIPTMQELIDAKINITDGLESAEYVRRLRDGDPTNNCRACYRCLKGKTDETGMPVTLSRMIVCPKCGNKRCPKATAHWLDCTGSNDPGQSGSRYAHPEESL